MRLEGVAAIVTGGGSGLGAATAAALARAARASRCWTSTRRRRATRPIASAASRRPATSATRPRPKRRVAAAQAAHGAPRVLVNCAGVATRGASSAATGRSRLAAFERVIRVNLIGTFNMIRLAAAGDEHARRPTRRRARRDRQHRLGRGLRRPDRAGGLCGVEGRRGRHDAADRARAGALRHPRR